MASEVIWMYWDDEPGTSGKPPVIEACLRTVRRNSDCDVVVVSRSTIGQYVTDVHPAIDFLKPAHRADLFRLEVLYERGGMYVDADTVVLRSLQPLFSRLGTYEYIGADWRPPGLPKKRHDPIGISVMGPCRPKLKFLEKALARQRGILDSKFKTLSERGAYPIAWEEILRRVVVPSYLDFPPIAEMTNGAESWFCLVSGPEWHPCQYHPYQSSIGLEEQFDGDLYSLSYSLMPEQFRSMSFRDVLNSQTILSMLLKRAGTNAKELWAEPEPS